MIQERNNMAVGRTARSWIESFKTVSKASLQKRLPCTERALPCDNIRLFLNDADRHFFKPTFCGICIEHKIEASGMSAYIPITSLTGQIITLIVRESAPVAQIHAPTYLAILTAVRVVFVYVGEVILYICA